LRLPLRTVLSFILSLGLEITPACAIRPANS
jgi:hypothetical protein